MPEGRATHPAPHRTLAQRPGRPERRQQFERHPLLVDARADAVGQRLGADSRHRHAGDRGVEDLACGGQRALDADVAVERRDEVKAAGDQAGEIVQVRQGADPTQPGSQGVRLGGCAAEQDKSPRTGGDGHDLVGPPVTHDPGSAGVVLDHRGARQPGSQGQRESLGAGRVVGKYHELHSYPPSECQRGGPTGVWRRCGPPRAGVIGCGTADASGLCPGDAARFTQPCGQRVAQNHHEPHGLSIQ